MSISLIRKVLLRNEPETIARASFQLFYRPYSQPREIMNWNECLVSHVKESEVFNVSFYFLSKECNINKRLSLQRKTMETVGCFLDRINLKILDLVQRKAKHKKMTPRGVPENMESDRVMLLKGDQQVDRTLLCETIVKDPDGLKLIVYDNAYEVRFNVPRICTIKLPSSIMAGFPTHPVELKGKNIVKASCTFLWYKCRKFEGEKKIGTGYVYTPSVSDVGYKLKIRCQPSNGETTGPWTEVLSKMEVVDGPGICGFEKRQAFTKERLSGRSFRMVSYNILAQVYTDTQHSKDVLFSYCPWETLKMDYRKQLILKELIGYNADVICLQEVDQHVYEDYLAPFLDELSYDRDYNTKKNTREGLAIFFDRARFDSLGFESKIIGNDVSLEGFEEIWSRITNEKAKEKFMNRSSIVQAATLRSKDNPSEILVVGNTHLYFHPTADHLRLLQAFYALVFVRNIAKAAKKNNPECNVSLLLCGDFNSTPESGVYQLMIEKYIPADYPAWASVKQESIENVDLKHDLELSSACGTPEHTNYTPAFSGCLDYIYYQTDRLAVERIIPMPSEEELSEFQGIPSVKFPSDHIALCVDLKWSK